MSPTVDNLTDEQRATIRELQAELRDLNIQADAYWAQYVETGDLDCFNRVVALEGEIEMKGLISYIPTAGEQRISKVQALVNRVRQSAGERQIEELLDNGADYSARIETLSIINDWRESFGLPSLDRMPQGKPGDAAECTIARAFSTGWDAIGATLSAVEIGGDTGSLSFTQADGTYRRVELGNHTAWASVVNAFDEYRYPDLIEEDDTLLDEVMDWLWEGGEDINADAKMRRALNEIERRDMVERVLTRWNESDPDMELVYDDSLPSGPGVMRWRFQRALETSF